MNVLAASVAAAATMTTSCHPESTTRTTRSAPGGLSVPGVGFTHVGMCRLSVVPYVPADSNPSPTST